MLSLAGRLIAAYVDWSVCPQVNRVNRVLKVYTGLEPTFPPPAADVRYDESPSLAACSRALIRRWERDQLSLSLRVK